MQKKIISSAVFGLLALAMTTSAVPVSQTELVNLTIVQNQPLEITFPNVFDLTHPKVLQLNGFLIGSVPGTLAVFFDWVDPSGVKQFSPVTEFPFVPGLTPLDLSYTIPFCPELVSVDFRLADAPSVQVVGAFTHTCTAVPEAGPGALGLLTLLGLCGLRLCGLKYRLQHEGGK